VSCLFFFSLSRVYGKFFRVLIGFALAVIDQSDCFGFGFMALNFKALYCFTRKSIRNMLEIEKQLRSTLTSKLAYDAKTKSNVGTISWKSIFC